MRVEFVIPQVMLCYASDLILISLFHKVLAKGASIL